MKMNFPFKLNFSFLLFLCFCFKIAAQSGDSLNFIFLNAVYDDNIPAVKEAIHKGADVNFTTYEGISALHYSVPNASYELIELLVENGANVNKQDHRGMSPLSLAASLGQDSVMFVLIMSGADIMIQNTEGQRPLHLAVLSGNPVAADILLFYGADPDVRDTDSLSALHYAAYNGMEAVVDILLSRGANPDLKDQKNQNAVFYAVYSNALPSLMLLVQAGADIWTKNSQNTGLLELSFQQGNDEIFQYILQLMESDTSFNLSREQVISSQVRSDEMWKSALKYDNIHGLKMLRKYKVRRPVTPVAGHVYGNIAVSGFSDFYSSAGVQFQEVNYKFLTGAGFGTRLWRNRVFMDVAPDTVYQLKEYRAFFYAELAKYVPVYRNYQSGSRIDAVAGLRTPFTWANYTAMKKKDNLRITYAYIAGIDYYHRGIKLFLHYHYWDYDKRNYSPHNIIFGLGFR